MNHRCRVFSSNTLHPWPLIVHDSALHSVFKERRMAWKLSVTLLTEADAIRTMRRVVRSVVEHEGGSEQEVADLQLAVGEALANAQLHAYPGKVGSVDIAIAFEDATFRVDVRDHGNTATLPILPESRDIRIGAEKSSLGLKIILSLVDAAQFSPTGDTPGQGTTLTMTKRLSKTGKAATLN
jgi:stage II sporulation protein AB (anti-sigma F factor)